MKKLLVITTICGSLLFLSGCETVTSQRYQASTENVLKMQGEISKDQKVHLGEFTQNDSGVALTCRLSGPVDVSPGTSQAQYIKEAMRSELFMADVYDINSETIITGKLEELRFSSVSPAKWYITLSVSSGKSEGYTVTTEYGFKTSFSAFGACKNVAETFPLAVQKTISDVISDPRFKSLL